MRRTLGEMSGDPTGCVYAMAESVELSLPQEDQQRLDKLADVRKNEDLWEHERRYEQSKRQYLGDDVLKSPASALVWWLSRNESAIDKAVANIGPLGQLAYAANDTARTISPADAIFDGLEGVPDGRRPADAADHLDALMHVMGINEHDPDRTLFGHQVADLVARRGHQSLADEIATRFDVQNDDTEDSSDM
jgi:hypothetical protein